MWSTRCEWLPRPTCNGLRSWSGGGCGASSRRCLLQFYSAEVRICEHLRKHDADAGKPSPFLLSLTLDMSDTAASPYLRMRTTKLCKTLRQTMPALNADWPSNRKKATNRDEAKRDEERRLCGMQCCESFEDQ